MDEMDETLCCLECFSDDDLRKIILERGVADKTPCFYCGTKNKKKFEVEKFGDQFVQLVRLNYIPYDELSQAAHEDSGGDALHDLFLPDFEPFSEQVTNPNELLYAILNSTVSSRPGETAPNEEYEDGAWFNVEDDWGSRSIGDVWYELKDAISKLGHSLLIGTKRSVGADPDVTLAYKGILSELEESVLNFDMQAKDLWRARRGEYSNSEELSFPPPEKATAGRGNLQGQPVLYLANSIATAVSEVRPSKGDIVSVCQFRPIQPLKVCDLRPHEFVGQFHPFGDFDEYKRQIAIKELRTLLSKELGKPVRKGEEAKDYLPTQYLCRMIAQAGFDGVCYPSAQGTGGLNYMLFDPAIALPIGEIKHVQVEDITYTTKEVSK